MGESIPRTIYGMLSPRAHPPGRLVFYTDPLVLIGDARAVCEALRMLLSDCEK